MNAPASRTQLSGTPTLAELTSHLDELLNSKAYKDYGLNGLQIDGGDDARPIKKVAIAVDGGLSIVEAAIEHSADLLLVHHGLFWGSEIPALTGTLGKKVRLLYQNECALYASHLPLDGHATLGNAACLASHLELTDITPEFEYRGMPIGVTARSNTPLSLQTIIESCADLPGAITPLSLSFGADEIRSVGIITGSGSEALERCKQMGLDLLISGEPKQEAYHRCKELEMNALFIGHYTSETFGVRAVASYLESHTDCETVFIDEPTGI